MSKLKGKVSILINRDKTTIEFEDEKANTKFATATLTPDQLSAALSRQICVDCELEVKGLDRVGKIHENKRFQFEITEELRRSRDVEKLQSLAQSQLTDGWIAESHFGSQDSFFTKEGKTYANTTIRRWIDENDLTEKVSFEDALKDYMYKNTVEDYGDGSDFERGAQWAKEFLTKKN